MLPDIQRFTRSMLYFLLGFLIASWAVCSNAAVTWSDWQPNDPVVGCPSDFAASGSGNYGWTHYAINYLTTATGQTAKCAAKCTSTSLCGAQYGVIGQYGITRTRTATCANNETWDSVTGQCVTSGCPVYGAPLSSGYYLIGTDPQGDFPAVVCQNGCLASFTGTVPAKQAIVSGVTNYYAQGSYDYVGQQQTCTGGASAPGSLSAVPNNTCAAGQQQGTVNGKTVCVDPSTGQPVNTNAPTTSTNNKNTTTTTNNNGTTTTNSTNQQSTTTCTGDECATTTTTTTNGGAGSGGTTTTQTQTQSKGDFCQQNPSDKQCSGTGKNDEDDPKTDPGTGASTSDLYTKGTRTVGNVLGDFTTKVQNAPFYQAALNFFNVNVPAGACTDLSGSFNVGWGQSFTIDATPIFCGSTANIIYSVLSAGIMIAALWVAFKIAIL